MCAQRQDGAGGHPLSHQTVHPLLPSLRGASAPPTKRQAEPKLDNRCEAPIANTCAHGFPWITNSAVFHDTETTLAGQHCSEFEMGLGSYFTGSLSRF